MVSNDTSNRYAPVVVVATIGNREQKKNYPRNVSMIVFTQLVTVDKDRLVRYRGQITQEEKERLDRELATILALHLAE